MFQNFLSSRSGDTHHPTRYQSGGETWILGTRYGGQQKERVRRHSSSLIRLTYRNKFPAMYPYTEITSDTGWGCMLRTAQMLMAQALQRHMLGRDWRIPTSVRMRRLTAEYREILKWFLDYPGPPYIYSIHHLVQCGMKYDKLPGEWYGPSTAAHVLKDLAAMHRKLFRGPLDVCVAQDGIVYKSEVEKICTAVLETEVPSKMATNSPQAMSDASKSEESNEKPSTPPALHDDQHVTEVTERMRELMHSGGASKGRGYKRPSSLDAEPEMIGDGSSFAAASIIPPIKGVGRRKVTVKGKAISSEDFDPLMSTDESTSFFDPLLNPPPPAEKVPWNTSLMLIVPLRLGKDVSDPEKFPALKSLFRSKYVLGIMGGWVNHAVFFVGYRGSKLLGLDPHVTFPCPSAWHPSVAADAFPSEKLMEEIHIENLQEMEFTDLDPSIAVAFYFREREEFESFCRDKEEHEEVLKRFGPSGSFGTGVSPLKDQSGASVGVTKTHDSKQKRPFDIVIAAKHHYFSLFGIMDVMPTLPDCMFSESENRNNGSAQEEWEIDSNCDEEGHDNADEDDFVIV